MDERYIYGELNNKLERAKPISDTIKIESTDWVEDAIEIEIEGVNGNSLVVCFYPILPTILQTEENMSVYSRMKIFCTSVSAGKIRIERANSIDRQVYVGVWIWL